MGIISSAMQPVVDAATLAAGRLAFGLGSMAQENVNGGTCGGATIQDDGSAGGANGVGYARVVFATVADATNQSVTCAFHGTQRIASGPITYTLPRANTLFNGFQFWVTGLVGTETITPNAADNFPGRGFGHQHRHSAGLDLPRHHQRRLDRACGISNATAPTPPSPRMPPATH